jgi:hypothetical protein
MNTLAWTLPEPHISTSENLHAKQKGFFSNCLRGFWANFCLGVKLCGFSEKSKKTATFLLQIIGCLASFFSERTGLL